MVSYYKDITDIQTCAVISVTVCPERLSNMGRIYNTILVTGTKWFRLVMMLRQCFRNPCSKGVILQTVNRIGVLATYGHNLYDILYITRSFNSPVVSMFPLFLSPFHEGY